MIAPQYRFYSQRDSGVARPAAHHSRDGHSTWHTVSPHPIPTHTSTVIMRQMMGALVIATLCSCNTTPPHHKTIRGRAPDWAGLSSVVFGLGHTLTRIATHALVVLSFRSRFGITYLGFGFHHLRRAPQTIWGD